MRTKTSVGSGQDQREGVLLAFLDVCHELIETTSNASNEADCVLTGAGREMATSRATDGRTRAISCTLSLTRYTLPYTLHLTRYTFDLAFAL